MSSFKSRLLRQRLDRFDGDKSEVAESLQISRRHLNRMLKELAIELP